jgi:UDP-N-acetyl-2-amino-2-deoxyglucuronate dehydrogenase
MATFALVGAAGFVAPRHMRAIRDTGNRLVAATDPQDSVGVLDSFSFDVAFFREIERFDRHLEKLRRGPEEGRVQYVSICSPNYLHDAHVRLALRLHAHAICEKPLVINPWNLDTLAELEAEFGRRIYTVLQLRLHPALVALRERLAREAAGRRHQVVLTYVTSRGPWYDVSWKGSEERSGGLGTNIGIHLFDLMSWLFGPVRRNEVHLRERRRMSGYLEFASADVRWFLSAENADLPFAVEPGKRTTFRSFQADGQEVEFTEGFGDLHTRVYEEILAGRGAGLEEARPSIELCHAIRTLPLAPSPTARHPYLEKGLPR